MGILAPFMTRVAAACTAAQVGINDNCRSCTASHAAKMSRGRRRKWHEAIQSSRTTLAQTCYSHSHTASVSMAPSGQLAQLRVQRHWPRDAVLQGHHGARDQWPPARTHASPRHGGSAALNRRRWRPPAALVSVTAIQTPTLERAQALDEPPASDAMMTRR